MSEFTHADGELALSGAGHIVIDLNAGAPGVRNVGVAEDGSYTFNGREMGEPSHEIEVPGCPVRLRLVPLPGGVDTSLLRLDAGALHITLELTGTSARQLLKSLKA